MREKEGRPDSKEPSGSLETEQRHIYENPSSTSGLQSQKA
jgi:hypothetical protein